MVIPYSTIMSKKSRVVSIKMSPQLNEIIDSYVLKDTHLNKSEFIRSAIREKIMKDAPQLITERF